MITGFRLRHMNHNYCLTAHKLLDTGEILLIKPNGDRVIKSTKYVETQIKNFKQKNYGHVISRMSDVVNRYNLLFKDNLLLAYDTINEKLNDFCKIRSEQKFRPVANIYPDLNYDMGGKPDMWYLFYGIYNSETKLIYGYTFCIADNTTLTPEKINEQLSFKFLENI